jgi:MFS family permease
VAFGCLLAAAGFVLLAAADGVGGMLAGWLVAQLGLSSVQAGLYATIPDQVPRPQLGMVAGWAGLTQMLGALLGTVVAGRLVTGLSAGYLAFAAILACALVPFLLRHREGDPLPVPRPRAAATVAPSLGLTGLRQHPDVLWAWLSRFLVMLGFAIVTQYLLYYLTDELHRPDPEQSVMMITALTVLCAMTAAFTAGRWSDRAGRRRVFVAAGGAAMSLGALGLALLPVWPVVLAAAVVIGLGFGTFLAVDLAVITSVLPSAADTGRDLGLFATAVAAAQILAPALAVPVLAVSGYPGLYLLTGAVCATGGAAVLKIRAVP